MEFFFNRYRNLSVLAVVLLSQLLMLAYQVRTQQDVRLIRVWAASSVMPLARIMEAIRSNTFGRMEGYRDLLDAMRENERLRANNRELKLENQFLKTELGTAQRAEALAAFQAQSPSRTIAARVLGWATDANSRTRIVDRGTNAGVAKDMAVITEDGLVGVVTAAFPTLSFVRLITDSQFGAGVISQNHRLRGVVKGQSPVQCTVEYIQNEGKIEVGEWFYTSGDDLMVPKGIPVGQVTAVRPGTSSSFKQITLTPSGFRNGPEEVLIVLRGVHQPIPSAADVSQPPRLLEPPPADAEADAVAPALRGRIGTDADRILEEKRLRGEIQGHVFGAGTSSPDFNAPLPRTPEPVQ